MAMYRKKPVVIEAWSASFLIKAVDEDYWHNVPKSVVDAYDKGGWVFCDDCIYIPTLEGSMKADYTDMVIRGIQGEFYPCKLDIFEATYEPVIEPQNASEKDLNGDVA